MHTHLKLAFLEERGERVALRGKWRGTTAFVTLLRTSVGALYTEDICRKRRRLCTLQAISFVFSAGMYRPFSTLLKNMSSVYILSLNIFVEMFLTLKTLDIFRSMRQVVIGIGLYNVEIMSLCFRLICFINWVIQDCNYYLISIAKRRNG